MASAASGDRNLLFGVLALQLDFLTRDALVAGMNAWAVDKDRPLGRILVEQGTLSPARLELLNALVVEHLNQHAGDVSVSLAAAVSGSTDSEAFDGVSDPDLRSTLTALAEPLRRVAPPVREGVRFRNLRPHAKGGLGQVFVADDGELNREVALKEIQPHRADDPDSRARFVREAEITGALEHPGVIPVYGLGTHPDGRPYYAMRLVRGETLRAAIERYHGLPAADRPAELRRLLRRLIDTCNAVAYAHSRGVVHRDLKPANILLGPFGETLVVDWGLAKAGLGRHAADDATTDPTIRPSSGSSEATRAGAALGTPGYMSPEQASGDPNVGPATDVFGLGAILYSVLTGRKPFEGTTVEDEVSQTRKGVFPPPREVNRDVPAPLDAVCRKALAREPADRYRSPLELAADLERWLADEPVGVFRDPWPVRVGRWAKRHRTGVAAAGVMLVTAAAALGLGTALLWREERKTVEKKREAEENYQLARTLSGSGIDLIAANEAQYAANPELHKARKELLDAAAKAYHKHVEHEPNDPEVRRQAARVYRYAANVHRLERDHAAAEPLYRDAVTLLEGLADQLPKDPAVQLQLCETLRDQAKLTGTLGRLGDAAAALDRVIQIADAGLADDPQDPNWQRARALGLLGRSTVQYTRGKHAEAAADAAAADALFENLKAAAGPYGPLLQGAARNVRAIVERDAGRIKGAYEWHTKAIERLIPIVQLVAEKKVVEGINGADALHFMAYFRLEQARTYMLNKQDKSRSAAETNLGKVAANWEALAAAHPEVREYAEMAGVAYTERARLWLEARNPDKARADLERAQALLEAEVKRTPDVPGLSGDLGRTYAGLARLARAADNQSAAADLFAKAVAALRADVERAPERARDARDLKDLEAEATR